MRSLFRNLFHCLTFACASMCALVFGTWDVFAQTAPSGGSASSLPLPTLSQPSLDRNVITPNPEAMIYDGAINPKEYRLGPGDVLQFRSWTNNETATILISADEMVVVPRIGEFSVRGKTFDNVKQEIRSSAAKLFKNARGYDATRPDFSLTLAQPRRIAITVEGEVETPGVYVFTAATRADIAVKVANKPVQRQALIADEAHQKEEEKRKREAARLRPYLGDETKNAVSRRYITIRHIDGTSSRADLARYQTSHDPRFCPLLREGDVIYVPFRRSVDGAVGVYGAVIAPSDFEFVQGDSLWGMIQAAYGPTAGADLTRVELTRMSSDGNSWQTQTIDALAIKEGRTEDVALVAGDRIFLRDSPDLREISRVIVKGEVNQPGVYPIHRTDTKLSEVVKMAGGFTPYAFLAGGTVTRKKQDIDNKDITTDEERRIIGRTANLSTVDTANFRYHTELREGYVAVDMARLFNGGSAAQDITLRDGDVISIPVKPTTVYVWGYVGSIGYIPYKEGVDYMYYINSAGGFAEGAVEDKTRIIKARTRAWVEPDDTTIEPGDEIYVPQEGLYPDDYTLRTTSLLVGILATVASTVATIIYLSR